MTDHSIEGSGRDLTRSINVAALSAKTLQEALGERVKQCEDHGRYHSSGVRYLGFREIWTGCPDCEEARLAADRQAEAQERAARALANMEAMLGQAAIPKRFMGRSLDNFNASTPEQKHALDVASEYAKNFPHHAKLGDSLVFSGLPGTGKSHLGTAIQQHLIPRHCSLYITCTGLIRAVRATWSRDSERTEVEVLREFGTVELLVIDEVGVQNGTDNEQGLIFDVLDRRYREMRPTILLTNQDKAGFKSFVGDRVFDRLTETARWVSFDWASYRPTARNGSPSNELNFNRERVMQINDAEKLCADCGPLHVPALR